MKKDWEYKSLNDLCSIVGRIGFRGYTKEDLVSNPDDGAITLSPSNIVDGELVFSKCSYINWEKYEESPEIMLKSGDVVLVKTASIGKCAVVRNLPHKATLNPQFVVLKDLKVNPEFITYYLKTPSTQSQIVKMAGGVAIPTLSQKKLGTLNIPVPPLSEQKEIVEYIDSSFAKIDKLKENAAKNLEEAKALFLSALKDALEPKEGWEEKTLKELSEIQSGYAFKSSDFKSSGKYQVIRMGNVRPGVIRYNESPVFINEELDEKAKEKALLQIGDMIITQTGSRNKRDYGFTVLIEKDNLLLNQRIARIRVKDKLLNKYLLYYSWTDYFRDQYFANEGGTVGQGNVGMDAIKDNIIPLPSLPEQQSIVSFLDSLSEKVSTLQQNYSRICDECDALKQAILRQVFE